MGKEEELKKNGWIRQFIASEPRLSECVELYKSLGYEVHLEPITLKLLKCEECKVCYQANLEKCKIIYIRPKH